jgi:hypothetical protein
MAWSRHEPLKRPKRIEERIMSVSRGEIGRDVPMAVSSNIEDTVRAGLLGGLAGGVSIWIYEAVVWVGVQRLMPLGGIPRNATGLVFGKAAQESLGVFAYFLGTGIHFFFCFVWGALFAFLWPYFRRRGYEATLVALLFAVLVWIVMHAAIAIVSSDHPNYLDPNVIIGGFMSHFFYAVPLALVVKHRLAPAAAVR